VELDVPVVMQVGHSAEFMPSELARPMYIDDIALYFPELRIVGAHTGWPWLEEMIAMAWKHPNVYLGTSAHAPKYWDKSMIAFLNTRGKGKVLWATDWPVLLHKESLEQVEELNLREDAKVQLLREAAIRVFKL
jgi:predicted TIM-barrel fold metal-dependent hydrolase